MQPAKFPTQKRKLKSPKPLTTMQSSITNSEIDREIARINSISNKANVILRKNQTKTDLVKYLHAACMNLTTSTFLRAIKNEHFASWPGLTHNLVARHLPKSMHAYQGHMNAAKQGLQSTKPKPKSSKKHETPTTEEEDCFPIPEQPNIKSNQACYALINTSSIVTGHMDLTGRFPMISSRGNQHILVGYHYDGNYAHDIPLKNRKGQSITDAWFEPNTILKKAGVTPEMHVLDNETSTELMQAFDEEAITYQLVTPYKHRNNQAEGATQIYENHFKSGLAGTDPNFPLSEWDRLTP